MPIQLNLYHPKWRLITFLVRFRRANGKCETCGAEHGKPHPATGAIVYLTTAHKNRNRYCNRFSNLIALCQRCHLVYDRSQHLYSRKYGKETQYINGNLFPDLNNDYSDATIIILPPVPPPKQTAKQEQQQQLFPETLP